MKAITFIAITLLAGAIAGTILGILNQGIVEPYIEQAIALENEKAAASEEGEIMNPVEFNNYRYWQRGGEIAAGTILGTSIAALFGMFMVGYDQGHLFSLVQGDQAYEDFWMHEFYHDMRHAAGFPCH